MAPYPQEAAMTAPINRKRKYPPLSCKCKEGRCAECGLCPRKSCKINKCQCEDGPTRLRVPNLKRKRDKMGQPETQKSTIADGINTLLSAELSKEASGASPPPLSPPLEKPVVPSDSLQPGVAHHRPLQYPEDVVEALQLPQRQLVSRFQRRKIAKEGLDSLQSHFEKQCLKRTTQTFREGVHRLAELLLPEAPEYLCEQVLTSSKSTEVDLLKRVVANAPRKSIQSRTCRAVLAAALPSSQTHDVMTKYSRQTALEEWELLRNGMVLESTKTSAKVKQSMAAASPVPRASPLRDKPRASNAGTMERPAVTTEDSTDILHSI